MLELSIITSESFDEETGDFVETKQTIKLEHSLLAISKWEFIFEKPFLKGEKTDEELFAYLKCMMLEEYPDDILSHITQDDVLKVNEYCNKKGTATWFSEDENKGKVSSETVTSELIYYWMLSSGIPIECETWYIHRLMTLIRVFSAKNAPPKKMSQQELRDKYRRLNEQRLSKYKTKG